MKKQKCSCEHFCFFYPLGPSRLRFCLHPFGKTIKATMTPMMTIFLIDPKIKRTPFAPRNSSQSPPGDSGRSPFSKFGRSLFGGNRPPSSKLGFVAELAEELALTATYVILITNAKTAKMINIRPRVFMQQCPFAILVRVVCRVVGKYNA